MIYLVLLLSLVALIWGADLLVRGAVSLAARLGISTLIIGLTVVAWGTSAPELVVSASAGLAGEYGIALGNIVGSNIANILLIGGVAAVLLPLATGGAGLRMNALLLLGTSVLLTVVVLAGYLSIWAGLMFVSIQIALLVLAFRARRSPQEVEPEDLSTLWAALLLGFGLVLVIGGGYALVVAAAEIAERWHVPAGIIGFSIVAIGTSLPELAATLAAVRQREGDLILGNIVGSNLANILIVFGLTALIAPGRIDHAGAYSPMLALMVSATLALLAFIWLRKPLRRPVGWLALALYTAFMILLFAGA